MARKRSKKKNPPSGRKKGSGKKKRKSGKKPPKGAPKAESSPPSPHESAPGEADASAATAVDQAPLPEDAPPAVLEEVATPAVDVEEVVPPADAEVVETPSADAADPEDVELIDLDADLEDDAAAVARLIAETVVTASSVREPEATEPPLTVIDLDAEPDDEPEAAEPEITVIDLDAELDDEPEAAEPEITVIDLDAELDAEPEAAERLIAAIDLHAEPDDEPEAAERLITVARTPPAVEAPPAGASAEAASPDVAEVGEEADDAEADAVEADAEEALRRLAELGPVSTPEVRSRLLAEALAHAEHKDARYRVPFSPGRTTARWKALVASVILLVAAAVAAAPPRWARPDAPALLDSEGRARNLRVALLLQAQQVEAFRVREQRLPSSLDEVTRRLPGLRYVRSGTRAYQLIGYQADGSAIVFDSTNPPPAFSSLPVGWTSPGGAP